MLLLTLLATLPTLPTLTLPFYGDDFGRIAAAVNRAEGLWDRFASAFFAVRGDAVGTGFFRPIYELSFALDASLFGLDARAMRAVELLSHTGASLLLARFALRWGASWQQAFFAGWIFAWAPQHIESIAWIAARGSVWSVALGLITLLTFCARPRRWSLLLRGLGLLSYVAAALTKELALLLPFPVFGYVLLGERQDRLRGRGLAALRRSAPLLLALAVLLLWRYLVLGDMGSARYPDVAPPDLASLHYWQTRLEMLGLLFVPLRLDSFPRWAWLLFAALPLLLLLRTLYLCGTRLGPGLGRLVFLLLWLLLGLAPLHWTSVDPVDFSRGRHLYALGLPAALLLSGSVCRPGPRIWSILLTIYCLSLGALQLQSSLVYREAGQVAESVYAQMDRVLDSRDPGVIPCLEDLPFEHRGVPIGSVLAARLGPPWRAKPATMPVWLHFDNGPIYRIGSVAQEERTTQLQVERFVWQPETRQLLPDSDRRSRLRMDADPETRCSGLPQEIRPSKESGVVELELEKSHDSRFVTLAEKAVERILYVEGIPRPGARLQLRVQAPPRSQVVILGPGTAALWRVRGIGTLLVDGAQTLAQGFADKSGQFETEWLLPDQPAFVGAELRLQAAVATPEGKGLLSGCWCRKILE
jgi:hypothetical protein